MVMIFKVGDRVRFKPGSSWGYGDWMVSTNRISDSKQEFIISHITMLSEKDNDYNITIGDYINTKQFWVDSRCIQLVNLQDQRERLLNLITEI